MVIFYLLFVAWSGIGWCASLRESRDRYVEEYFERWSGEVAPPKEVKLLYESEDMRQIIKFCRTVVAQQRLSDTLGEAEESARKYEMRREDIELLWTIHDFLSCAISVDPSSRELKNDPKRVDAIALLTNPDTPFDIPQDLREVLNTLDQVEEPAATFSPGARILVALSAIVFYGKLITSTQSRRKLRQKK